MAKMRAYNLVAGRSSPPLIHFGPLPAMTLESIGYGAGTKDFPDRANLLRILVGTTAAETGGDTVWQLETNLDDVPGEIIGYAKAKLLAAGALDVFSTAIQMKKDRPGTLLSVLCELRDRGFSLQKIRRVIRFLQRELGRRLVETVHASSECHLLTDGEHIFLQESARGVVDLLKNSRQPMLTICLSDTVRQVRADLRAKKNSGRDLRPMQRARQAS